VCTQGSNARWQDWSCSTGELSRAFLEKLGRSKIRLQSASGVGSLSDRLGPNHMRNNQYKVCRKTVGA
jgi:hypothetical protein